MHNIYFSLIIISLYGHAVNLTFMFAQIKIVLSKFSLRTTSSACKLNNLYVQSGFTF